MKETNVFFFLESTSEHDAADKRVSFPVTVLINARFGRNRTEKKNISEKNTDGQQQYLAVIAAAPYVADETKSERVKLRTSVF